MLSVPVYAWHDLAAELARKGILELLDWGSALKTPAFQRSFAWTQDQVEDYWNDLTWALDRDGGPVDYFLGLIVVDEEDEIQDGQQRLATTLLLASEIYDAAEEVKKGGSFDRQLASEVAALVSPALREGHDKPLTIGLDDQDALLGRAGIRGDSPQSVRRLVKARECLHKLVRDEMGKCADADERLRRLQAWGRFLRKQAFVIVLSVPHRDAHTIFETLNTRGVRLSNGDLVKSHLIARADDTAAAVKKWGDITGTLKDKRGNYEENLESFLLHYYGSRYGKTVRRELFTDFRPRIAGGSPLSVLDELHNNAVLYRALLDPIGQSDFWARIGVGARQAIELVNGLGLKQLRYLLLAVLRDFGAGQADNTRRKKQRDALVAIAGWSVRSLVHFQTGGGEAEKTYIGAAERIRDGRIKTVAKLREWFIEQNMLVVDDGLFETAFKQFAFDSRTSHTRARAVLYALEYEKISDKSALVPRDTLTVEHVLPESPEPGEWTDFTDDERRVYLHRLGNLLLIDGPSGANNKLGNQEWPGKRALIKTWGDQTPLTTEALARSKWDEATIDDRQDELARLAVKAFPA